MTEDSPFRSARLCVVGNVNRDVKVAGLPATPALLEDGETSVGPIIETIGGGGANSACAAAALGANVSFIGKVGDDALGTRLTETMRRHGVRTHLARDAANPTGTTVALGYAGGQRHFVSCLPNNDSLTFDDLDLSGLDATDTRAPLRVAAKRDMGSATHLLRADVWFSQGMLAGGNERLFREARGRGMTVSLDINWDPCWSGGDTAKIAERQRQLASVLELVDMAHGNVRELCRFTDAADLDAALRQLTRWGVKAVVVHMGSAGAGYYSDGRLIVEPPCPAAATINATGTGDVLSVCMILLHGREDLSIPHRLKLANRVVAEFMEGRRVLIPTLE